MGITSWADAISAAKKVLGDNVQIPDPKMNWDKLKKDEAKSLGAFNAARDDLEAKILALENVESKVKNMFQQHEDRISKSDFELDPKKPEEKKKIDKAQKVLNEYLESKIKDVDDDIKNLNELDKHANAISDYEGEKCSK